MTSNEKLTCAECGREITRYAYGNYCDDCAAEVWDHGFETTSEWAEDVTHSDALFDLHGDYKTDPGKFEQQIRFIQSEFETAGWYCNKCKAVRLSEEQQTPMSTEQVVSELSSNCPSCGCRGFLGHHFKPS